MLRRFNRTTSVALMVGIALSGCTISNGTAAPQAPSTVASPPTTAAPSTGAPTTAAPSTGAPPTPTASPETWSTDSVEWPDSGSLGSGAYLVDVRVGGHPEGNFDRIAFDFQGRSPALHAHYIPEVAGAFSGIKMALSGGAFLLLDFTAAAHNNASKPTLPDRLFKSDPTGLPGLVAYVTTGDWEGHLDIALGQATKAGFKVGQLNRGGGLYTLYVDVARS